MKKTRSRKSRDTVPLMRLYAVVICTYLFTVQSSNSISTITDFPDFSGNTRRLKYAVSPRFIHTSLRLHTACVIFAVGCIGVEKKITLPCKNGKMPNCLCKCLKLVAAMRNLELDKEVEMKNACPLEIVPQIFKLIYLSDNF